MNVVGRVGSLITQGVYSVATPFHPFGGAVDVIVVKQQDGTFRSTPWYVRFGKFQGVLKGAEKIVRISVNGVEANFHMYLDNSGGAYFIKEVDTGIGTENGVSEESENLEFSSINGGKQHYENENVDICRLDHGVSDSAVAQMKEECESFGEEGVERAESDSERRFYEFQDELSSLDGSVELSEFESTRYDNLDCENAVESQNLDSEVVLVSVDGHILTAPITASEQNTENVQLSTPQFHLGPGEGTKFCDGNDELSSGENPWAADYISKLNSSANDASDNASGVNNNDSAFGHQLEVCEGEEEHDCQVPETHNIAVTEGNVQVHNDSEDVAEVKKEEVFKNSSDKQVPKTQNIAMTEGNVQVHNDSEDVAEFSKEEVLQNSSDNQVTETQNIAMTESDSGDLVDIEKEDVFKSSSELSGLSSQVEDNQLKYLGSSELSEHVVEVGKEEVFKNPSEVTEPPRQVEDTHFKDLGSSSEVQSSTEAHQTVTVDDETEDAGAVFRNIDGSFPSCSPVSVNNDKSMDVQHEDGLVDQNADGAEDTRVDDLEGRSLHSVAENSEWKGEQSDTSTAVSVYGTLERSMDEDESTKNEQMESTTTTSSDALQTHSNISFEISLCGNKLQACMGSDAAAEAFNAHRISAEEFKSSAPSIIKNGNLIVRFRGKYLPWEKAAHIVLGMAAFGLDLPIEPKDLIPVEPNDSSKPKNDDSELTPTSSGRRWRIWSIPFRRVKTLDHTDSNLSNEEEFVDSESVLPNSQLESPTSQSHNESPRKQFVRTNVPTNEQIASLNLKDGQNFITFSFSTRVLGKQQVDAHIYLWKWNARIVISDVDGTITKSDVLGQFMPLVGKDWSQSGVAKLFSAIKENGYQLLFLSARAIVQAYLTRSFLVNLKQDGNTLPNGPVVISPDGLLPSLYREVIRRAPHEFKIACLEDIKRLFPSDYNPFYAGFGNRDTDELSYKKIGIPKGKIFIINPKGEVAISHRIDVKSYTSLHTLVNDMFPSTSLVEQEDFNSWNFWKMPMPDIDL